MRNRYGFNPLGSARTGGNLMNRVQYIGTVVAVSTPVTYADHRVFLDDEPVLVLE